MTQLHRSLPVVLMLCAGLASAQQKPLTPEQLIQQVEAQQASSGGGGALAIVGADPDATAHVYGNFLGLLSTWAAPWAAILIASRSATTERYGRVALIAWGGGIAAGLPFWQQSWFTGPIAAAHPQLGDLSYFVSFGVAYAIEAGAGAVRSRK